MREKAGRHVEPVAGRLVSVVIPCYRQANWLPEAIESAMLQTYPVEIVVVNDGSPDDTSEVASRYPVVLVEQENAGLPSARNAGIRAASGDFILPLDSDDTIEPTYVEKAVPLLEGGVRIVNCWQHDFGDHDRVTRLARADSVTDLLWGNRATCCSLFRKADWIKVGGYDEQMTDGYEDWEFWIRLLKSGGRMATIPEPLFNYRKHGQSMIDSTNLKAKDIFAYIQSKHIGLYGRGT